MKIRNILHIEPTLEATSGLGTIGPLPARVIYIHPAGRYYTVESRREPHFDYTKKLKT